MSGCFEDDERELETARREGHSVRRVQYHLSQCSVETWHCPARKGVNQCCPDAPVAKEGEGYLMAVVDCPYSNAQKFRERMMRR